LEVYPETLDPSELKDFTSDWVLQLGEGETLSGSPAVAFVDAAGTSNPTNSLAGTVSRVWLTGGTHGGRAIFTVAVTTSGGRTLERAFAVDVIDNAIGPAAETDVEQATRLLAEARAAQHALRMGERVVDVWKNGGRVRYAETNAAELDSYVKQLERDLTALTATEAGQPRRRPINLMYRN
jgi:hypothetical protein